MTTLSLSSPAISDITGIVGECPEGVLKLPRQSTMSGSNIDFIKDINNNNNNKINSEQ